jgi:hypothetical protein
MAHILEMSVERWNSRGFALNSRAMFEDFLRDYIASEFSSYDECSAQIIMALPNVLTRGDRYIIHKFTIRNEFDPASNDTDQGRVMEISLSKNYVMELMRNYPFPEPAQQPIVFKTDKQILFESMLQFIQTNLPNEFDEYMRNI